MYAFHGSADTFACLPGGGHADVCKPLVSSWGSQVTEKFCHAADINGGWTPIHCPAAYLRSVHGVWVLKLHQVNHLRAYPQPSTTVWQLVVRPVRVNLKTCDAREVRCRHQHPKMKVLCCPAPRPLLATLPSRSGGCKVIEVMRSLLLHAGKY